MRQLTQLMCLIMLTTLLNACSGVRPNNLGIQEDRTLAPCPGKPNCVSSFAPETDRTHYIAPYRVKEGAWPALADILREAPNVNLVEQRENYLYAEAKTRLIVLAAAEPAQLYPEGDGAFEFERTASRLQEMRSADWLADRE